MVTVLPRIGTNTRSHMRTNFIFLVISARGCAVMPVDRHGQYRQVSRCLRSTRRRDSNCRSRLVVGVCSGAARPGAARRVRRCGSRDQHTGTGEQRAVVLGTNNRLLSLPCPSSSHPPHPALLHMVLPCPARGGFLSSTSFVKLNTGTTMPQGCEHGG